MGIAVRGNKRQRHGRYTKKSTKQKSCLDCKRFYPLRKLRRSTRCEYCQAKHDEARKPKCYWCRETHQKRTLKHLDVCASCEDALVEPYERKNASRKAGKTVKHYMPVAVAA